MKKTKYFRMTLLLISFIIFLSHNYLRAQNNPQMKFIKTNGDTLFYEISKIDSLLFSNITLSPFLKIYTKKDSLGIYVFKIKNIFIKNDKNTLTINFKGNESPRTYNIAEIDSINITDTKQNYLRDKYITTANITISGLKYVFYETSEIDLPDHTEQKSDTTYSSTNINLTIRNNFQSFDPVLEEYYSCPYCYKELPTANFWFCYDNNWNYEDSESKRFICSQYTAKITLDTINQIITNLTYINKYKEYITPKLSSRYGNQNTTTNLILNSIPYQLTDSNTIVIDLKKIPLSQLSYNYYYYYTYGNTGRTDTKTKKLIKILSEDNTFDLYMEIK